MTAFKTHKGETPTPEALKAACDEVAEFIRKNGHAILKENDPRFPVTDEIKQKMAQERFDHAGEAERGEINSFTTWQLVNIVLTGECVAFLP